MNQIFISYRREDSAGHAGRLAEELKRDFDEEAVFFDTSTMKPGQPFPDQLRSALAHSEVVLAIIGKRWWSSASESGRRRLLNKNDWVRIELSTALKAQGSIKRLVIPILVEGTAMPSRSKLPKGLKRLTKLHAIDFSTAWSRRDQSYSDLLTHIDEHLGISDTDRSRFWIYDFIVNQLDSLTNDQRRQVSQALTEIDAEPESSCSPRTLAKRFYRTGPQAIDSLRQIRRLDDSLRPLLELLKDYWVAPEASQAIAKSWVTTEPFRSTIVVGKEELFTPHCLVQKASNSLNPWRIKQITSGTSQPDTSSVLNDICEWLRRLFAESLRRSGLHTTEDNAEVRRFLQSRLRKKAEKGNPIAVLLDEVGATDESLLRAIQLTFPHLRIMILVPGNAKLDTMERRYFQDLESNAASVAEPEITSGDEQRAADNYYEMAEDFIQE